jgi:hypothetical protein
VRRNLLVPFFSVAGLTLAAWVVPAAADAAPASTVVRCGRRSPPAHDSPTAW